MLYPFGHPVRAMGTTMLIRTDATVGRQIGRRQVLVIVSVACAVSLAVGTALSLLIGLAGPTEGFSLIAIVELYAAPLWVLLFLTAGSALVRRALARGSFGLLPTVAMSVLSFALLSLVFFLGFGGSSAWNWSLMLVDYSNGMLFGLTFAALLWGRTVEKWPLLISKNERESHALRKSGVALIWVLLFVHAALMIWFLYSLPDQ